MSTPRRPLTPDELLRSKVGANIKRSLRRLWVGDMEFDELVDAVQPTIESVENAIEALRKEGKFVTLGVEMVVEEMWMSPEAVSELAKSMGLGERVEPECYLPSPEEIRLATARFRSEWSQAERECRLQGSLSGRLDYAPRRDTICPPKCD